MEMLLSHYTDDTAILGHTLSSLNQAPTPILQMEKLGQTPLPDSSLPPEPKPDPQSSLNSQMPLSFLLAINQSIRPLLPAFHPLPPTHPVLRM